MEPYMRTYREIGRLCVAWSFLEGRSEQTLWGILNIDQDLGEVFTWTMNMQHRWQMIVRESKKRLSQSDYETLKSIQNSLSVALRDRNIIIHGLVNSFVQRDATEREPELGEIVPERVLLTSLARTPCWTIYVGEDKGRNFSISTEAVKTVINNVSVITARVTDFNKIHNFRKRTPPTLPIETEWPKRL
jgi:hypothetical protein